MYTTHIGAYSRWPRIYHMQLSMDDEVDDVTCMTFVFRDEDHTLGNALRYVIMKK